MTQALFLADAHLSAPDAPAYQRFLQLLAQQHGRLDTLVLLGDIFEFITGYPKTWRAEHQPALEALAALAAAGTRIIWVEGNHDFALAPFHQRYGFTLLPDGGPLTCGEVPLHLSHGDTLDPQDHGYRWWRALLRSVPTRLALRWAPRSLIRAISHRLVDGSRRRRKTGGSPLPKALLQEHARRQWRAGAAVVVCGHFHHPWDWEEDGRQLYVLGAWCDGAPCLVLENGRCRWAPYPVASVAPSA